MSFETMLDANVAELEALGVSVTLGPVPPAPFTLQVVDSEGAAIGRPVKLQAGSLEQLGSVLAEHHKLARPVSVHYWDEDFEEFVLPGSIEEVPPTGIVMLLVDASGLDEAATSDGLDELAARKLRLAKLDDAFEVGAITEQQYTEARARLLPGKAVRAAVTPLPVASAVLPATAAAKSKVRTLSTDLKKELAFWQAEAQRMAEEAVSWGQVCSARRWFGLLDLCDCCWPIPDR